MSGRRYKKNQRLGSSRRGPKGLNRNFEKDDDDDGFQQIAESGDGKNEFHTTSDYHSAQFDHPPSSSIDQQTSALECLPHARSHKDSLMETELPEGKRKMGSTRKSAGGFKVERKLDELRTTKELDEYVRQPNISSTEEQHSSLREDEQSRPSFPSNLSLHTESSGLGGDHRATLMDVVSENEEKYAIHHQEITSHSYELVSATVSESDLLQEDPVMFNKLKPLSRQETPLASTTGQKRRMGSTRRPLGGKNSENVGVQEHSRSMTENERKAEVIDEAKFSMSKEMAQMWDDVVRDDPSSHTETSLVSNQFLLAERAELNEPDVSVGTETINQSVAFPLVNPEKPLPETSRHNGSPLLYKGLKFGSHTEDFNVLNKVLENDNQHVPDTRNDTNTSHDCRDVNTAEGKEEVLTQKEEPSRNKKTCSLSLRLDAQLEELVLNCEESPSLSQHTAQFIEGGNIRFDVPASNISHAEPTATNSPHEMGDALEESQEIYVEMKHKNNVCDVASITSDTLTDLERAHEDERGSENDNGFEIIDQGDARDHNVTQIIMESRNNKEDGGTSTETVSHQELCEVSNENEELHKEREHSSTISQIQSGPPRDNAGKMLENNEVREDKGETENAIIIDVTSKSEERLNFKDSATDTRSHAHQQLFMQSPGKEGYDLSEKLENVDFDGSVGRSEETEGIEGMDASLLILEVENSLTNVNTVYNDSESDLQTENPDQNRVLKEEQNYTSPDIIQEAFQVSDNVSTMMDSSPLLHVAVGFEETDTTAEESDISRVIPEDSQDTYKHTTFHSETQFNQGDAEIVPVGGDTDLEIQTEIKSFYSSTSEAVVTEENSHDVSVLVREFDVNGDTVTVESNRTTKSDFLQTSSEALNVSENPENEVSNDISIIPEDSHREEANTKSSPVVYKRKMGSTRRPLRGDTGQRKRRDYHDENETFNSESMINVEKETFSLEDEPSPDESTSQISNDGAKEQMEICEKNDVGPVEGSESDLMQSSFSLDSVSEESTAVTNSHITESQTLTKMNEETENAGDTERVPAEGDLTSEAERTEENILDATVSVGEVEFTVDTLTVESNMSESDLLQNDTFTNAKLEALKVSENTENVSSVTDTGLLVQDDATEGSGETDTIPDRNDTNIIPEDTHREETHLKPSPIVHKRKMGSTRRPLKGNKGQRKGIKYDEENDTLEPSQDESTLQSSKDGAKEQEMELCEKNDVGPAEGSESDLMQSSFSLDSLSEESIAVTLSHITESQTLTKMNQESQEKIGDAERVPAQGDAESHSKIQTENKTIDLTSEAGGTEENNCEATVLVKEIEVIGDTVTVDMINVEKKTFSLEDEPSPDESTSQSSNDGAKEQMEICEKNDVGPAAGSESDLMQSSFSLDSVSEESTAVTISNITESQTLTNIYQGSQDNTRDAEKAAVGGDSELCFEIEAQNQSFVSTTSEAEETEENSHDASVSVREDGVFENTATVESDMTTESVFLQSSPDVSMEALKVFENTEKEVSGETDTILKQSDTNIIPEDTHREETHSKLSAIVHKRKMGSTRRPLKGLKGQRKETEHYDENETHHYERGIFVLEDEPRPDESSLQSSHDGAKERMEICEKNDVGPVEGSESDLMQSSFSLDSVSEESTAVTNSHITESQTLTKMNEETENARDTERVPAEGDLTSEVEITEENLLDATVSVGEVEFTVDTVTVESNMSESDLLQNDTFTNAKLEALKVSENTENVSSVTDTGLLVQDDANEGSGETDTIPDRNDTNIIPEDTQREETHLKPSPIVHKRKMGSTRRPLKGNKGQRKGIKYDEENDTLEPSPDESTLQSSKDGAKEQEMELCEKNDVGPAEGSESDLMQASFSLDSVSEESTAVTLSHITESQTLTKMNQETENAGDTERVPAEEDLTTSEAERTEENILDATVSVGEVEFTVDTLTVESNMSESDLLQNDTFTNAKLEALKVSENTENVSSVTDTGLLVQDDLMQSSFSLDSVSEESTAVTLSHITESQTLIKMNQESQKNSGDPERVQAEGDAESHPEIQTENKMTDLTSEATEGSGEKDTIPDRNDTNIIPEDTHREETHLKPSPVIHKRKMGSTRRPLKGNTGQRKGIKYNDENETLEPSPNESTLQSSKDGAKVHKMELCEKNDVGPESDLMQSSFSLDSVSEESTTVTISYITESQTLTKMNHESQKNSGDTERVPAEGDTESHPEIQTENKMTDLTSEAERTEENICEATVLVREVIGDTVTVDSDMTTESDFHQNASSPDAHVEDLKVSENVENKVSGETDTITEPSGLNIIPEVSHREEVHTKPSPVVYKRKMGSTRRPLRGDTGQRKGIKYNDENETFGSESMINVEKETFSLEDEPSANISTSQSSNDAQMLTDLKLDSLKVSENTENVSFVTDTGVLVQDDATEGYSNVTTESDFHQNASSPDAHVEELTVSENVENKVLGETDTIIEASDLNIIPEHSHREEVHRRKMGSTRRPLRGNKGQRKGEEDTETLSEIQDQDNVIGHNVTQEMCNIRDDEDEERMTTMLVGMSVQLRDDLKQEHRSDVSQTQTGPSQNDTGSLKVPERTADIVRDSFTSHSDLVLSDALPMEETQIHVSSWVPPTWVPPTEVVEMHSVSNRSLQKRKMGSTRKRGKRMVNEEEVEEEKEGEAENTDGTTKFDVQTENSEQNDQNQAAEIVSDLPLGDVETHTVPEQSEIISIILEESHRKDVQPKLSPVVQKRKMGSSRKTLKGNKGQRREVESKKMDGGSKGIAKEQDTDTRLAISEGENKWKFESEDGVKAVSLNIHDPPKVSEEKGLENTVNDSNTLNEAINLYAETIDKLVLTVSHEDVLQTMSAEYLDQHVHGGSETEQTETMCHVLPTQELENTQDDVVYESSSQKIPCTKEKRRKMGSTRKNPRVMYGKDMGDQDDILGMGMERETKKAEDDLDDMPLASRISQPKEMASEAVSTTDLKLEMSVNADLKGGKNDYQNNSDPSGPSGPEPPENTLQICENQLVSADVTRHLQPETVTVEKRRKMGSTRKNIREGGIRGKRDAYEDTETADTHLTMSQDSEISLVGKAVGEQTIHDQSEDSLLSEIERALNKTSQSSSNYELNINEPNSGDLANAPYLNNPENSEIKSLQPQPSQTSKTHSEPNSPERRRRKMGSTRRNPRQQLKTERKDEDKEDGEVEENSEGKKQEIKNLERVEVSVVHNIPENKLNKEYLNVPSAHTSSSQLEESGNPVVQERTSPSTKRKFGSRRTNKGKQGLGRLDASDQSELEDKVNNDLTVCDPYHSLQPENQPISKSITEQSNMEARNEEAAPKGTGAGLVSLDQIIKRDRSAGTKQTINMQNRNSEIQFNVVMVGNSCVGKTSFIRRFHEGQFTEDYRSTIGVDTCMQTVVLPDRTVKLQIWDTAGQERFHSITRQVFHKADGLLLMYEITCSKSFISVRDWISQARERAPDDAIMILLGNKNDSVEREVQVQEGVDLAKEYNIHFMECSAASGSNVSESMMTLAELLVQRKTRKEEHTTLRREPPPKKSGCC